MGTALPLSLPVRLRMMHGLSTEMIRNLKHLRDGIQLALAHAQASKEKEKFVLPLKEYRRALDWCSRCVSWMFKTSHDSVQEIAFESK